MANDETDPIRIGVSVFNSERGLWNSEGAAEEHLCMCNEAAIRIAVLAERKRCVETIKAVWDDYVKATGDDGGKRYLHGYRDGLEDGCEALMQLDPQEGADLDSVMAAVADEKRLRARQKTRSSDADEARLYPDPEEPELDAWDMMLSGKAQKEESTEEIKDPSAIEGAEQIDSFVKNPDDEVPHLDDLSGAEYE